MANIKKNPKTKKTKSDVEKFVLAVSEGDNVRARELLEKTLKSKAHAKIKATLDN